MTKELGEIGVETLHRLALERKKWQVVAKAQVPASIKSELLGALTERAGAWELTLAALGASISTVSKDASSAEIDQQMRVIVSQVRTHINSNEIPGFDAASRSIFTVKHQDLIGEAEYLASIFEHTVASATGIIYCLKEFPEGGPKLRECIRKLG